MKQKIKILFLITDLKKGGAERFLIDFCTELQKCNDVVFKIAPLYDNNEYEFLTQSFDIEPINYKTYSLFHPVLHQKYLDILNSFQPDIIHTNRFLAEFLSAEFVDKKYKYVCHGHDNMIQFQNFSLKTLFSKKKFIHYLEKRHLIRKKYKYVDTYIIANSTHTLNYFKNTMPKNQRNHIVLIQNPFNFSRFFYNGNRKLNSKLKLINVGSFQDKKNQIFFIDVALEIKKRNIDFEIHLVGGGENFDKVKSKVEKNRLNNYFVFHGIVDNVEDLLKESYIYVHSAYYEPFGLVFLEAMAAGLPVVTLDGKGNRDIIINDYNGYLIEKQDALAFVDKIQLLAINPNLYQQVAQNAQKFAKKYDVSTKVTEFVEFYKKILK